MLDVVWLNLVELSKQKTFREILSTVTSTEKEWKKWFDSDAPEEEDIPCGYQVHFHLMRIPGTLTSHADIRYNYIPYHITVPCGQYFIIRLPWMCFGNCCSSGPVALTGHWHRFLETIVSTIVTTTVQARKYIYSSLGADFLESAVLDIEHLLEESDNKVSKIICI